MNYYCCVKADTSDSLFDPTAPNPSRITVSCRSLLTHNKKTTKR